MRRKSLQLRQFREFTDTKTRIRPASVVGWSGSSLQNTGMATNKTLGFLFFNACSEGNVDHVRHCIGLNVDINCYDQHTGLTGLIISAFNNQCGVVELLLLQPGIDVNKQGLELYLHIIEQKNSCMEAYGLPVLRGITCNI